MTNPWLDPSISAQQRALVDRQLAENPWPPHFRALAEAVRATQCPGDIAIIGCGVGHEREILDRAGVSYRSFTGVDISPTALVLAKERYPESMFVLDTGSTYGHRHERSADVVVDGSAILHVDDWRAHLAALCRASRRWVILHRVPVNTDDTRKKPTHGYGREFDAWEFGPMALTSEMERNGFVRTSVAEADGGSTTLTFARPRHWASYCDRAYLPRLRALHASMKRHAGPFVLHVLAWDEDVLRWCEENGIDCAFWDHLVGAHDLIKLPGPHRTRVELMWTCGPFWIRDVMAKTGDPVTYIDADLYAFSSPEPFFAEAGGAPAAFVGHNFAPASRGVPGPTRETHEVPFGRFNVGLNCFADIEIAQQWAELCQRWCFDRIEGGKFADQKYLEWLAVNFNVRAIQNEAAMVGPWNIHARALDVRDGVPYFGNRPIGFFHFSALKLGPHGQWQPSRPEYRLTERQIDILYTEYLRQIDNKETP